MPENPPEPTEWKFFGVTSGELTKIILAALFGVLATALVTWATSKQPHLTVLTQETIHFRGEKNSVGLINFTVSSDGSKEVKDVECMFDTKVGLIKELRASPEELKSKVSIQGGKVSVIVPLMNVGEKLSVTGYAEDAGNMPDNLDIKVRGEGVIGSKELPNKGTSWEVVALTATVIFLSLALVMTTVRERFVSTKYQYDLMKKQKEVEVLSGFFNNNAANSSLADVARWISVKNSVLTAAQKDKLISEQNERDGK